MKQLFISVMIIGALCVINNPFITLSVLTAANIAFIYEVIKQAPG